MLRPILLAAALALSTPTFAQDPVEDILIAARNNQIERVQRMIGQGMDPNTADRQGSTLLFIAAFEGHLDLAKYLLAQRARVRTRNSFGDSPIMVAALKGNLEMVRLLAAHGSELNNEGWTALHYCAWSGHLDICRLLLDQGARVDVLSANGTSPLMMAARQGHAGVVNLLLSQKPDLQIRNDSDATALTWAREYRQLEIARALQAAGAKE